MRRAADRPGLVCLRGAFAQGHPVLSSHPLRTTDAAPPDEPTLAPLTVDGVDVLAGGWFGVAALDPARTRFAFHDHVLRLVDGRWRFEALWTPHRAARLDARREEWTRLLTAADVAEEATTTAWTLPDRDAHLAAVERAVELIRAGELYQVNVCARLTARLDGGPAALFAAAAEQLDPRYGAFVTDGERSIACLSPELFLRRRGRTLRSAPIKGTLPAGPGQAQRLRGSTKDVAENVMIVDLVRNDLGRVCETGSVRPVRLLEVVERVGVLHLVSAVEGTTTRTDAEVFAALFPPASVTGTPKLRALSAIEELEGAGRGVHTGAVGVVSPCWGAEFAVAIRTLEIADGRVELGVGGGVTVDSVPDAEWQECLHKAEPIVRATGAGIDVVADCGPAEGGVLETILALDGHPLRAADHLARLERSVHELYGRGLPADLPSRVARAARPLPGRAAVRVVVAADGAVQVAARPAADPPGPSAVRITARAPGLWRHKWADRSWAVEPEGGTALYVAQDATVLETVRGNVFLLGPDGTLVTAPLRPDLLPGVTRRALLDHARDTGRRVELRGFDVAELCRSVAFWTSSLSGAVPIAEVDGTPLPRDDDVVAGLAAQLFGVA